MGASPLGLDCSVFELRSSAVKLEQTGFALSGLTWHPTNRWFLPTSHLRFGAEAGWWCEEAQPAAFPCAVCCRTSSGSLWCLSNSHFSELQAVFGKVQALSRSNGYGFSSTGTPQEVNAVCVIQTPQFLPAHHLVFRVIVLIPAETQYGPVKKNKQHKPTIHTQKPMQLLSSRPWGQHPWGTLAHFLKSEY